MANSARGRFLRGIPVAFALVATGCAALISGHPVEVGGSAPVRHIAAPLASLLPDPAQFPPGYPAVTLSDTAAVRASGDLDGVGRGARVRPPECAPDRVPNGADGIAVAVGSNDRNRATITVELRRTRTPLAALRERLRTCEASRVQRAGAVTEVRTELGAAPAADADDTLSWHRSVTPQVHAVGLTESMHGLVGQCGDIRITVAYMTFGAEQPDESAVRNLFGTAVAAVRAG